MIFTNDMATKSITQMRDTYLKNTPKPVSETSTQKDFKSILENKKNSPIQFSKHAAERLNTRNINITQDQVERLTEAKDKLKEKGVNNALVFMDNVAYVINTKNSTVITMMDHKETIDNVFTNIDGAVISN